MSSDETDELARCRAAVAEFLAARQNLDDTPVESARIHDAFRRHGAAIEALRALWRRSDA